MPREKASPIIRTMLNRATFTSITRLTLLAFILNATLPFYLSSAADAAFSISGSKALLCTIRGYEWVDLNAKPAANVVVIKSPLAKNEPPAPEHAPTHCSLCYINPHSAVLTPSIQPLPLITSSGVASASFNSIPNIIHQLQHFSRLTPTRAPPGIA